MPVLDLLAVQVPLPAGVVRLRVVSRGEVALDTALNQTEHDRAKRAGACVERRETPCI